MKPEQGKVLLVNDDIGLVRALEMLLMMEGYETFVAVSKPEALAMIPELGKLGVRIALIDGNLSHSCVDGSDGVNINEAIKRLYGDLIKTAGISAQHSIPNADIPRVSMRDFGNVLEAVHEL